MLLLEISHNFYSKIISLCLLPYFKLYLVLL